MVPGDQASRDLPVQTLDVVYILKGSQPIGSAVFDVQLSTIPNQLLPTTKSAKKASRGCNHMRNVLQSQANDLPVV